MAQLKGFSSMAKSTSAAVAKEANHVDGETGLIVPKPNEMPQQCVDLEGAMAAPAFIILQTNVALGFHFTQFIAVMTRQKSLWSWILLHDIANNLFRYPRKGTDVSLCLYEIHVCFSMKIKSVLLSLLDCFQDLRRGSTHRLGTDIVPALDNVIDN